MSKVAIVTGGVNGMGLGVATALSRHSSGPWSVHLLDLNAEAGSAAASAISATFHLVDITHYTSLAAIFAAIYREHGRLDFVFANAGIVEKVDFYDGTLPKTDEPPPPPPATGVLDVNLGAVITTSWLALHYFGRTRLRLGDKWEGNLIMTASVAGYYPNFDQPIYTAAKHGVIGLTRALGPKAYHTHHVRTNCICPDMVLTGMTAGLTFPAEHVTPMQNINSTVMMLIEGKGIADPRGTTVRDGEMYGRAVEVDKASWKFKEMDPYPDKLLPAILGDVWSWGKIEEAALRKSVFDQRRN